jgi:WD40 repeat protein
MNLLVDDMVSNLGNIFHQSLVLRLILKAGRKRMFGTTSIGALGGALVLGMIAAEPANATLALTPDGIADGFTLTTFVSGYNFGGIFGPLAQGILPNGNVITGSRGDDKIYVFKDVDNQALADAVSATPYTFLTVNPYYAMTTAGGQAYGAQLQGAQYEHFNSDGTHSPISGLTATNFLGMWGNPINGHIISSANQGLIDIDPVAGTFRVIAANPGADGVSVSPDGKTLYAAINQGGPNNGNILAYDIATGALLHTYSGNGHRPDGTGVITGGKFNGFIIVNDSDGTVGLIDPTTGIEDIIASGGTQGDFVSPDTNNGTLFLSQLERVDRLICPADSTCSPITPQVPEPASITLLGGALLVFGTLCRRILG